MSISIGGTQGIINTADRIAKKLGNTQAQIASGLQNPNPATDPIASTLSKSIDGNISIAKRTQSVAQQANKTVQIAYTVLRANADILTQMRAQAIEASNGTYSNDRASMNDTFQQNIALITENALSKWGSRTLLDGTLSMNCQTGTVIQEANVSGSIVTSPLNTGDLTINGIDVGAASGTAQDIATAINAQAGSTQVIASALTSATGVNVFSNVVVTNPQVVINGVTVPVGAFSGTESADQIVDQVVAAINAYPGLSGQYIVASNASGYLQINATDGSNLTIAYSGISPANIAGPNADTYVGAVTLASVNSITVGGNNPGNAGFTNGTTAAFGVTTITLSDMQASAIFGSSLPDLTTQSNAQAAIAAIDTALANVSAEISRISLYSKQLENVEDSMGDTVLGLQDNLAAVRDVNFAEAISDAARLEVMQEAATAVLGENLRSLDQLGHLVAESLRGN